MYNIYAKRTLDIIISVFGLLILCPLLIIVSICLFFFHKGNGIIFTQERVGKNNKIFKLIKFKTMSDAKDKNGNLLPDVLRLTKIGRFLRDTSIDELPQLINVAKGDMSLIGPRPLLIKYLKLYTPEQARRHKVRPGITGWAQVNGRNTISWKQKFEYDIWYVDNITLKTDIKILLKTTKRVFFNNDINAGNGVTMPAFNGKN